MSNYGAGRRPTGVPLCPCMVTASAASLVGLVDYRRGWSPWVHTILRRVGLKPGARWAAALVTLVGYRAHQVAGIGSSSWPMPLTGRALDLVEFAMACDITRTVGEEGDISVIWTPQSEAAQEPQVGFVLSASVIADAVFIDEWTLRVTTVEGNVTRNGAAGGPGVYRVTRDLPRGRGALFLNWPALDTRRALGDPAFAPVRRSGRRAAAVPAGEAGVGMQAQAGVRAGEEEGEGRHVA